MVYVYVCMPAMKNFQSWLDRHKFEAHLAAFVVMVVAPLALYLAARNAAGGAIWALLCLVALANLLVVLVR